MKYGNHTKRSRQRTKMITPMMIVMITMIVRSSDPGTGDTTTASVAVPSRPPSSVTVRVTANVPLRAYRWVATTPEPAVPSPKSQAKATIVASSVEADPSNVNSVATAPEAGVTANAAVGGRFPTDTERVDVAVAPSSSHTVRVTANVWRVAYACVTVVPESVAPSPKSQEVVTIVPSESVEVLVNVNVVASVPDAGVTVPEATGGALTVTVSVSAALAFPSSSLTVRRTT